MWGLLMDQYGDKGRCVTYLSPKVQQDRQCHLKLATLAEKLFSGETESWAAFDTSKWKLGVQ